MNHDPLLTLREVSERVRLPISTLRHYRQHGKGPKTFKVGKRVMARESDVNDWLGAQQRNEQTGGQA